MPSPVLTLLPQALHVAPGQIIDHRYRVERVIGSGAMGLVVAAVHLELEQRVAIKFLAHERRPELDPAARARFRQEARSGARLRGDHVCRVLDAGYLEDDTPFLVMEYLEGQDMDALLLQRGKFPLQEAAEWVRQACTGLADAHALGLVHRDLKPSNLFIAVQADGTRTLKLVDFGISKCTRHGTAPSLTMTSELLGSPLYMSPEQLNSAKDVDSRSDIWSLGVILFELITGQLPFVGDTLPQVVVSVLDREPSTFEQAGVPVPSAFEQVVRKCLSKSRSERYANVAELKAALEAFVPRARRTSLVSTLARSVGPLPELPMRGTRRNVWLWGLIALGMLGWLIHTAATSGEPRALSHPAAQVVQPAPEPPAAAEPKAEPDPLPVGAALPLLSDEPRVEEDLAPRKPPSVSSARSPLPSLPPPPPSAASDNGLTDFGGRR